MCPSGMGFTSASWRARRQRYGVSSAPVSAGSNHVGARVMCIAHVICPAGAPFCAMARCRDGHPCHVAHPATPLRVLCRKRRRDNNICPWRLDVMPLPPSECADRGTGTVCQPTRSQIGVRCEHVTAGVFPFSVYAQHTRRMLKAKLTTQPEEPMMLPRVWITKGA